MTKKMALKLTILMFLFVSVCHADESIFTVVGRHHLIDRPIPHMYGQEDFNTISIGNEPGYITGASISFTSPERSTISNSVLCHAFVYDAPRYRTGIDLNMPLKIVLSQGAPSVHFPEGFGLRLKSHEALAVLSMAVDPHYVGPAYQIRPAMKIHISKGPLKELHLRFLSAEDVHSVMPGVTTYQSKLFYQKRNEQLHYANIHVHAYAESVEIRDMTEDERICLFNVKTLPDGEILDISVFSSVEGIPMLKGHYYRTFVTYNNRSNREVDVMAGVFLYVHRGEKS